MNRRILIGRRAACGSFLGLGAGLLFGRSTSAKDRTGEKATKKPKTLSFDNSKFYHPDGKFDEDAAKQAYLRLCKHFGYPVPESVRKNLAVTDFALGKFTEAGLAYVIWVDEKEAGYASLEVFLLPGQMIPEHWHVALEEEKVPPKMESWLVRYGETFAYGDGAPTENPHVKVPQCQAEFVTVRHETPIRPGEVAGVKSPLEKHWQVAGPEGCILTEISTYHTGAAVKFTDPKIKF